MFGFLRRLLLTNRPGKWMDGLLAAVVMNEKEVLAFPPSLD